MTCSSSGQAAEIQRVALLCSWRTGNMVSLVRLIASLATLRQIMLMVEMPMAPARFRGSKTDCVQDTLFLGAGLS